MFEGLGFGISGSRVLGFNPFTACLREPEPELLEPIGAWPGFKV